MLSYVVIFIGAFVDNRMSFLVSSPSEQKPIGGNVGREFREECKHRNFGVALDLARKGIFGKQIGQRKNLTASDSIGKLSQQNV